MISWSLWRALAKPPQSHPLYRRIMTAPTVGRRFGRALPFTAMILLAILCTLSTLAGVVFLLYAALALAFPFVINAYALRWTVATAMTTAEERERGTYDLLCLLPFGGLGATWIISAACAYRAGFHHLFVVLHWLLALTLVAVVIVGLNDVLLVRREAAIPYDTLPANFMIESLGAIALLYVDYAQTIILGMTIAVAVSSLPQPGIAAALQAGAFFLLVQMTLYLIVALIGFTALPQLYLRLHWTGWAADLSLLVLRLALLCGLREVVIVLLWRWLEQHYGTDKRGGAVDVRLASGI